MFITKLVNRSFIGILLLLCTPLATAATLGPKAQVPETAHDFGEVFEDVKLTHTFTIKNIGDARLEIKNIDSDCVCTAADSDRRISPGGQGRITLTVAPYSVLRQFTKKTRIFFNDPDHSQVVLTMQGYGKPFIEIQPSRIIRFRGKPGEELRDQVRFISHLPGHWEIKAFKTNGATRLTLPATIYGMDGSQKFHQIRLILKLPLPWGFLAQGDLGAIRFT